ncbi:MAG TPA: hypothetical protein VKB79_19555 [Bryobacteraceae bacterium]|nr:hypothetical protein [Bryobacteraceae bacterium]
MRIDSSHRNWAVASVSILGLATLLYLPYSFFYPGGARGNSLPGLIYGVLGYGMMLYAGLMGARKKVPLWRIGRASVWMRGHLWLGALSLPMILFHSAFYARGPLTFVLMTLLVIVILSGLTGAMLQHFLPRRILSDVPLETIYEQIPTVREQLRAEASTIVDGLCRKSGAVAVAAPPETGRSAPVATAEEEEGLIGLTESERMNLRQAYNTGILPFLRDPESPDSPLGDAKHAAVFFEALRKQLPTSIHESLSDLESICDEERQLTRQGRFYLVLHGWLLIHVPISITLLVLGGIHAIVAIRY